MDTPTIFSALGIADRPLGLAVGSRRSTGGGPSIPSFSPIDGELIADVGSVRPDEVPHVTSAAKEAFYVWRRVPAPTRGELVRRYAEVLRRHKKELGALVTLECGKIPSEAEGEVQEMIDICDFAVGLSRQLYGKTIQSERPQHRLMEQWHPLGPIGVISAFNFPVAVWSWNAALALVCGDPIVWKPSEKTPICAFACHSLLQRVVDAYDSAPDALSCVVNGGRDIGKAIAADANLPLISATGSIPMGRDVGQTVAARLGRSLLELGGNNALVVTPSADIDLAIKAITFAAVGTAGQRCTSLRRLIVHHSVKDKLVETLNSVFHTIRVGDPREDGVLVGPLIDEGAAEGMVRALAEARSSGGKVHGGERVTDGVLGGAYVRPAIVEIHHNAPVVHQETFAPILYVMGYESLDEAIQIQNEVPQGLSSAIFTADVREAEIFCSPEGSDCGIANVNIGTSGAEIGGAFGGEKETGGGRESGSDSWKYYMRRATNTVNYGNTLPLAQGVRFS